MHVFTVRTVSFQVFLFAVLLELETLASTPASERTDDEYENRSFHGPTLPRGRI